MKQNNPTPPPHAPNAGSPEARQLQKGLTRVPYWGRSEDGRRIPCGAWVLLRPGESVSDAAHRLTNRYEKSRNL